MVTLTQLSRFKPDISSTASASVAADLLFTASHSIQPESQTKCKWFPASTGGGAAKMPSPALQQGRGKSTAHAAHAAAAGEGSARAATLTPEAIKAMSPNFIAVLATQRADIPSADCIRAVTELGFSGRTFRKDWQRETLLQEFANSDYFLANPAHADQVIDAMVAMRAEAMSAATAAGGGTPPPPQASGTLPPVPTVQHYFGGTARIQALEEMIMWLCVTVSKQVWICVLLTSSKYSFATSTCTATSAHTTQAILRLSECINAKNTFKLVNKALLTSVSTTVQPPSSCPKIIVMKNRRGLHNVCIFHPSAVPILTLLPRSACILH
jgi:hypothetical protein